MNNSSPGLGQMRIPDILETIADLSNDEVFTPPDLANKVLDMLPESIWSDSSVTFLDPATKTGVFLREITKRLIAGLEHEFPDLQERVNHILTKQVYGLGITKLTSLMSRRTVYCSTTANGIKSVCTEFDDIEGNIKFPDSKHSFNKHGKCTVCGAGEDLYYEEEGLDNYAYSFLHDDVKEVFGDVKFDVIIGNPPYQLEDGGVAGSATAIYDKFVMKALSLKPKYISMIIPARWYIGGKGLNNFREMMLNNENLKEIHDFENPFDLFKNMGIAGGICYFLIDSNYKSNKVKILNYKDNIAVSESTRELQYGDSGLFIRSNLSIEILDKVNKKEKGSSRMNSKVLPYSPFNIRSNFEDFSMKKTEKENIKLYRFGDPGYIKEEQILNSKDIIEKYKVLTSKARGVVVDGPNSVISEPFIAHTKEVSTETYLVIDVFDEIEKANNLISYMKTKFFRYMVSIAKNTQNMSRATYQFVPLQDLSKSWTDEELYKKYKLTEEEIAYIEENIEAME